MDTLGDRISAAARSQFDGKAWHGGSRLEVFPDPAAVAARAGGYVAGLARAAVAAGSRFSFAVSGGRRRGRCSALSRRRTCRGRALSCSRWTNGGPLPVKPGRELTHLRESRGAAAARVPPMPAEGEDLAAAARAYAAALAARFDLVRLGLGPVGRTRVPGAR